MKRFFNLLFCIFKSQKFFSIEKKKFVIFDCVNSVVLSEILPKDQTYIISARAERIKKILINFKTISFLMKNLFSRSMQLNYFISLINQIDPKFVITTIDNSLSFSILTRYFENKIKFIAIQNATRGDFYKNTNDYNKSLYYTNYMGLSIFDFELIQKKNIKVKNFFPIGSLRNSYYKKFIHAEKNDFKKSYDICFVGKKIFKNGDFVSSKLAEASLILIRFLAQYVKKYNKNIVIQSKSQSFNYAEKFFYDELFVDTNYKISWIG